MNEQKKKNVSNAQIALMLSHQGPKQINLYLNELDKAYREQLKLETKDKLKVLISEGLGSLVAQSVQAHCTEEQVELVTKTFSELCSKIVE